MMVLCLPLWPVSISVGVRGEIEPQAPAMQSCQLLSLDLARSSLYY